MDNTRLLTALTGVIENILLSGDFRGLEDLSGTRRDRNGDLLVDFTPEDRLEMVTIRIQLTTVQSH